MQPSIVTTVIVLVLFTVWCSCHPVVRKKRESDSCAPYDDDQNPIRFRNPEDCAGFFECNSTGDLIAMSCEYGEWFNSRTSDCQDVDLFPTRVQQNCINKIGAEGSTRNLRDVFVGRCLEYQQFRHPEFFVDGPLDCKVLFKKFTKAFQDKNACGQVKFGDYNEFLQAAKLDLLPKDKLLFWSSINEFSQEFSNKGSRLFPLEETLPGYLINELTWCGRRGGINFETCPPWGICDHHPMVTFWEEASQQFAKMAVETITLMLNGSMPGRDAFRPNSFFAQHELPSLTKKINKVRIWVAHALEIPVQETCKRGSLLLLKQELAKKGFNFNCQDNPAEVLHLLCVDNPFHRLCKSIKPKKDRWVNGRLFGFEVKPIDNSTNST